MPREGIRKYIKEKMSSASVELFRRDVMKKWSVAIRRDGKVRISRAAQTEE